MLNIVTKSIIIGFLLLIWVSTAVGQTSEELYEKMEAYAASEDYVSGEIAAKQLISLDSLHYFYWLSLGWFQHHLEKQDEALESYTKAISLNDSTELVYLFRAHLYFDMGEPEKAKRDYASALAIDPFSEEALNGMAFILSREEDYVGAITYYERLIAVDPSNFSAALNLAYTKGKLGEFTQALMDYNRLIEDHPDNAQLHNNRADLYLQMHIYDEAMKGVNVALEIAPNYNIALATKGQIYYGLGDYEKACRYFKKALTNGFGHSRLTEYLDKCESVLMED